MLTLEAGDFLAGVAQTASKVTCTIFGMEFAVAGPTETYKVLDQRQLPTSAATIYTTPASNVAFIRSIAIINTDTANSQAVQLYRGGTGAVNALTQVLTLPPGGAAYYEDGSTWMIQDNLGQLLQRAAINPILSAVLTASTANQTSTTEAIVSPVLTVPANYCAIGTTFELDLFFSAAAGAVAQTTPGMLFQLRWGGLTGTVIGSIGTITPATTLAALGGHLRSTVNFRSIGATGSCVAGMTVTDPRGTRVAAGDMASKTGILGPTTVDTTIIKDLVATCKATVADAAAITFGLVGSFVMERQ